MFIIRRIWYRAAAVIVLAIILSILLFKPFSKLPPNEVFAEYNRQFQKTDEIIEMARNDNDFLFASEVYEAGDYERAAALFENLADVTELRNWSLLYAGSSYMFSNQTEKAIDLLLQVIIEGEGELLSQARWRLALCYIKTDRSEDALEQLKLLHEDPEYRRDAGRIIRILR